MGRKNTLPLVRSNGMPGGQNDGLSSTWPFMEEVVNLARGLGTDSRYLGEVARRCPFNRLESSEMMKQRAFASGPHTGDFLQAGLAHVASPSHAVRADRKTMRLVTQPLNKIKHGIARLELERLAARQKECLEAGVAIRSLCDGHERYIRDPKRRKGLLRRRELTASSVDDDQVGPRRLSRAADINRHLVRRGHGYNACADSRRGRARAWGLLHETFEAAAEDLAHHAEIVARREIRRAYIEFAILVFLKSFGTGDDHRADRIRPLNVAVVVDFNAM